MKVKWDDKHKLTGWLHIFYFAFSQTALKIQHTGSTHGKHKENSRKDHSSSLYRKVKRWVVTNSKSWILNLWVVQLKAQGKQQYCFSSPDPPENLIVSDSSASGCELELDNWADM